ncbi:MAG: HAD-IA family hydrolase [Eubacterium sp.]|nr:HAD-IA family hydrolase [Eubacterium sp.]
MKKYDVIIFDLDGTLSDSGEGITKSVQYALEKLNILEDDLDNLKHFVGPPLKAEFMKSYYLTEEQGTDAVRFYRERYIPTGIYETSLYEGVRELLDRLKADEKIIAMATSKPQPLAEEVLKFLEIENYFDFVMGADMIGGKQSKEDVLSALLEVLPIKDKSQMIMVGDTNFDVLGAEAVGISCIGVAYGYGDKKEMSECGAVAVVNTALELLNYIE